MDSILFRCNKGQLSYKYNPFNGLLRYRNILVIRLLDTDTSLTRRYKKDCLRPSCKTKGPKRQREIKKKERPNESAKDVHRALERSDIP